MSQNTGGSGAVHEDGDEYELTDAKGRTLTIRSKRAPTQDEVKALFDQEFPVVSTEDQILNSAAVGRETSKPNLTLGDIGDIAMSPVAPTIAGHNLNPLTAARKGLEDLGDISQGGTDSYSAPSTLPDNMRNFIDMVRGGSSGLMSGIAENTGKLAESISSPVGLASMLLGAPEASGVGKVIQASKAAQIASKALSGGIAAAGAKGLVTDKDPEAIAQHIAMLAGGGAHVLSGTGIGTAPIKQVPARMAAPILDAGAAMTGSKGLQQLTGGVTGAAIGSALGGHPFIGAHGGVMLAKAGLSPIAEILRDASARVKQSYKGPEGVLGELDNITKNPPQAPEDITADGLDPRVLEATRQIHQEGPAVLNDDYNYAKQANSPLADLKPDPKWQSEVDAIKAAQEQDRVTNESQRNLAAKNEQSAKEKVQARKDAAKAKSKESKTKINVPPREMIPEIAKSELTDNQKVMLDEAQATRDAILRGSKDPKKIQQANERFESKKKAILAQAN